MSKEFYNKKEVLYEFEDSINKGFHDSIIKADFLDDIIEMISSKCIISLTLEDIKEIENDELVGTISMYMDDCNDEIVIKSLSNNKPTHCVINFISSPEFELSDMHSVIKRIEKMYPKISVRFGSYLDNDLKHLCKIQALLTCSGKSYE